MYILRNSCIHRNQYNISYISIMPLLVEMGDEDGQRMMEDITVGINGSSLPTYTKEVDG
jgi:hypothetical protein